MANQTITLALIAHAEQFNASMRSAEHRVDEFGDAVDDVDGRGFRKDMDRNRKSTDRLDRGLSGIIRRMLTLNFVMKSLKFIGIYTGIRLLLPLLSAMSAMLFALVTSMGAFAGLIGLYPGIASPMISAFGAIKFATAGLGESFKVLMADEASPEDLAKALKETGPQVQAFARDLKALQKAIKPMQKQAQESLFGGLNRGLAALQNSGFLGLVTKHFVRMNEVIGDIIANMGEMLGSRGVLESLRSLFRANERTIKILGRVFVNFVEILTHVAAAAQPLVERVMVALDERTKSLLDRVRKGVRDGSLQRFFTDAFTAAQRLAAFIGTVWRALRNVNDVLEKGNLRDRFITPFEEGAAAFEKYTESLEGQQDILRWFKQSADVMDSFYRFIGRIMQILRDLGGEGEGARVLTHFLDELSAAEGPLDRLFTGLGNFDLMNMANVLLDVLDALASLVGLLPTLEILVDILGYFARGAKAVFDAIAGLPKPVKDFLGALLAMKVAFVAVQTVWLAIVGANLLKRIALGLWKIKDAFLLLKAGSLGAFAAAMPWLAIIALLAAGIYTLWQNSETFRRIVTGAWDAVREAAQYAWEWIRDNWRLITAFMGPVGWAINHIVNNFDALKSAAMAVWGWIKDNWRSLLMVVNPFLSVIVAMVENFNAIKTAVTDAMNTVKEKFRDAVDFVQGLPGAGIVINAIEAQANAFSAVGRGVGRVAGAVTGVNGDTSAQGGSGRGGGLAATLAMHRMVDRMTPGSRTITNATRGKWAGSEHHKGRALDLRGSFMGAYAKNLAAMGGGAERHAQGSSPHHHAVFPVSPGGSGGGGGGGGPSGDTMRDLLPRGGGGGGNITIDGPLIGQVIAQTEMDVERAAYRALERIVRERRERA